VRGSTPKRAIPSAAGAVPAASNHAVVGPKPSLLGVGLGPAVGGVGGPDGGLADALLRRLRVGFTPCGGGRWVRFAALVDGRVRAGLGERLPLRAIGG